MDKLKNALNGWSDFSWYADRAPGTVATFTTQTSETAHSPRQRVIVDLMCDSRRIDMGPAHYHRDMCVPRGSP